MVRIAEKLYRICIVTSSEVARWLGRRAKVTKSQAYAGLDFASCHSSQMISSKKAFLLG